MKEVLNSTHWGKNKCLKVVDTFRSDEDTVPPVTITNEIRFVNRLDFYLGNGSKKPAELFHESK